MATLLFWVRRGLNGLLVPPGDAAALRAALQRLFDDADLRRRLAAAGPRLIDAGFAPAVMVYRPSPATALRTLRTFMHPYLKQLRYGLKRRLTWLHVPIKGGPLAGQKWCMFTGIRFVRGDYHQGEVAELQSLIKQGDVVYDIGAHVGYYALVAAQKTGAAGRVVAFEPLPLNLQFLRKHIAINKVANIDVLPLALSDASGTGRFDVAGGTGRGRIAFEGGLPVETASLDELCESGRIPPPNLLKMDIEGAELAALQGARKTLARYRPIVFLATHGDDIRKQCEQLLTGLDYELRDFRRRDIVAIPKLV